MSNNKPVYYRFDKVFRQFQFINKISFWKYKHSNKSQYFGISARRWTERKTDERDLQTKRVKFPEIIMKIKNQKNMHCLICISLFIWRWYSLHLKNKQENQKKPTKYLLSNFCLIFINNCSILDSRFCAISI